MRFLKVRKKKDAWSLEARRKNGKVIVSVGMRKSERCLWRKGFCMSCIYKVDGQKSGERRRECVGKSRERIRRNI